MCADELEPQKKENLMKKLCLNVLACFVFSQVMACSDDKDVIVIEQDAAASEGGSCSSSSRNGVCTTVGAEGRLCCDSTSAPSCSAGDCSTVCLVCK